jgi:succinate dehydrogenase / fumarate reductase, cytochrome b subunit
MGEQAHRFDKEAGMAFGRKIGLQGLRYQGGGPMLAWVLHRIGGLAMVIFVGMHIASSFLMQQLGSDLGTALNTFYESWQFQAVLYFFVIFHALNGLRIILLDLRPQYLKFQRESTWLQWIIFIPLYGLTVFIMIMNGLSAK